MPGDSRRPRSNSSKRYSTSSTFRTMPRARKLSHVRRRFPFFLRLATARRWLGIRTGRFGAAQHLLPAGLAGGERLTRRFPRRPKRSCGCSARLGAAIHTCEQPRRGNTCRPNRSKTKQPEEPVRQRKQRLARRCRPFLERFFKTWDDLELEKSAAATVAELKSFADEIGLSRSGTNDLADLARLWGELDRWAREVATINGRETLTREQFARVLSAVGAAPCRARTTRSCGVALLSAERAVGLDCDYLFLVGLGEGSWPDLAAPSRFSTTPSATDSAGPVCALGS